MHCYYCIALFIIALFIILHSTSTLLLLHSTIYSAITSVTSSQYRQLVIHPELYMSFILDLYFFPLLLSCLADKNILNTKFTYLWTIS